MVRFIGRQYISLINSLETLLNSLNSPYSIIQKKKKKRKILYKSVETIREVDNRRQT